MVRYYEGGIDDFSKGIEQLIGSIPPECSEEVGKATERSVRKGVKSVKKYASKGGVKKWGERYVSGFSCRVKKGIVTEGEIGNKNEPGLVHLLEKGHLTLTGRRTRAFPHLAPAFDDIQKDFIKNVESAVGKVL